MSDYVAGLLVGAFCGAALVAALYMIVMTWLEEE